MQNPMRIDDCKKGFFQLVSAVAGILARPLDKRDGHPQGVLRRRSVLLLLVTAATAWPLLGHAGDSAKPPNAVVRPADIVLGGKIFCSLKRNVVMPFRGIVSSLKVRPGQFVKEGEVLARYKLPPDVLQQIRRRLAPTSISELQGRLADLDKSIAALDIKLRELRQLVKEDMAPAQSVENAELERQTLAKHRASVLERLGGEKQIAKDDLAFLREQLGKAVKPNQVPQEASLVAPISGHVMGIQTDLREGAELAPGTPALVIGILDPMVMKTSVHELEAVQVALGDEGEMKLESMPERSFKATVSRLSWTPATPGVDQPSYYELELTVPNPDLSLREGLKGYVTFRRTGG
jgi:multidrug efflux pump subunit AcrA (membrane-fusion protein)